MTKESKEKQPDGPLGILCRRREGQYEVVSVSRKGGQVLEEVLKSTPDKRIAADRAQQAILAGAL